MIIQFFGHFFQSRRDWIAFVGICAAILECGSFLPLLHEPFRLMKTSRLRVGLTFFFSLTAIALDKRNFKEREREVFNHISVQSARTLDEKEGRRLVSISEQRFQKKSSKTECALSKIRVEGRGRDFPMEQPTVASQEKASTSLADVLDVGSMPKSTDATIQNELPTYRAIERMAVLSLGLGVFSVLSFANLYFVASGVLAVAFGILADRRIKRFHAELTGRGLAQTGIALGLIFGLTSVTSSSVSDYIIRTIAEQFARKYTNDVLMKGKIADAVWYAMPAETRAQYTTNAAYEKIKAAGGQTFEQQMGGIVRIKERLDSVPGKTKVEFIKLEAAGQLGEKIMAFGLLRVTGPATARFPVTEEYALAEIEARRGKDGKFLWQASTIDYPYQPKSKVLQPPKPVDDGHGHPH